MKYCPPIAVYFGIDVCSPFNQQFNNLNQIVVDVKFTHQVEYISSIRVRYCDFNHIV